MHEAQFSIKDNILIAGARRVSSQISLLNSWHIQYILLNSCMAIGHEELAYLLLALDVLYAIHQLTITFVTYIFKITSLTFLFFRRARKKSFL